MSRACKARYALIIEPSADVLCYAEALICAGTITVRKSQNVRASEATPCARRVGGLQLIYFCWPWRNCSASPSSSRASFSYIEARSRSSAAVWGELSENAAAWAGIGPPGCAPARLHPQGRALLLLDGYTRLWPGFVGLVHSAVPQASLLLVGRARFHQGPQVRWRVSAWANGAGWSRPVLWASSGDAAIGLAGLASRNAASGQVR